MEERRFELSLPDGRKIVWRFLGSEAISHLEHLEKLVLTLDGGPAAASAPVAYTVTVDCDNLGKDWVFRWPNDGQVSRNRRMSSGFRTPDEYCITLHRHVEPTIPFYSLYQSQWLLCCGFLPLLRRGEGMPVHGALLARDGCGVILCGPPASGKSTCARRIPPPWEALADDLVLVTRSGGEYYAQGLPTWSQLRGKAPIRPADVNRAVKLAGVYRIIQADFDRIDPLPKMLKKQVLLDKFQELKEMWQVRWYRNLRKRLLEMAAGIIEDQVDQVEVGLLNCSLHGEFWTELEKVLEVKIPCGA